MFECGCTYWTTDGEILQPQKRIDISSLKLCELAGSVAEKGWSLWIYLIETTLLTTTSDLMGHCPLCKIPELPLISISI